MLSRRDNLAAKLVPDFSAELFWAGTVVNIRVAGLERPVRWRAEASDRDSSRAAFRIPDIAFNDGNHRFGHLLSFSGIRICSFEFSEPSIRKLR